MRDNIYTLMTQINKEQQLINLSYIIEFLKKYKKHYPLTKENNQLFTALELDNMNNGGFLNIISDFPIFATYNYDHSNITLHFSLNNAYFVKDLDFFKKFIFYEMESYDLGFLYINKTKHKTIYNLILKHYPKIILDKESEITKEEALHRNITSF
jgi:hypothetical protein